MTEPLEETEKICKEILTTLPREEAKIMRSKVEALIPKIAESRKKLMLRSQKGKELTTDALNNATKLREFINSGKTEKDVSQQLQLLEASVGKIEIYWKSFEYVTT